MRPQDRVEQPRANDVVCLRTEIHRERPGEQVLVVRPAAHALRRHRRGRPRVHDVRITGKAAGLASLVRRVAVRHVRRRIDRQCVFARGNRTVVIDAAVGVDRVPDGKRHAEESLPAHTPVAVQSVGPVLVPRLHVGGMPLQLASAREQRLAELDRLEEPLAAGDDFQRPIAFFEELHGVRDRTRVADEISGFAKLLDDLRAGFRRRQPHEIRVEARRPGRDRSIPSLPRVQSTARSVPSAWIIARTGKLSSRHQMTSVTSPNVQIIAMPLPFDGSASVCALTGTRTPNSGVRTSVPNSGL